MSSFAVNGVVDHIQLFERHWRKMVADHRVGKLDRNLHIDAESRMIFEIANIPKPGLSERLDNTFRHLGFHKKVLGKDIQIVAYAKKKHIGVFAEAKPRRKLSLPSNALSGALKPLSPERPTKITAAAELGASAVSDIGAALAAVLAQFTQDGTGGDAFLKRRVSMSPLAKNSSVPHSLTLTRTHPHLSAAGPQCDLPCITATYRLGEIRLHIDLHIGGRPSLTVLAFKKGKKQFTLKYKTVRHSWIHKKQMSRGSASVYYLYLLGRKSVN
jgi:hypothetical protein